MLTVASASAMLPVCQPNHGIHDESLSVVRPGESRRLLFAASPAETQGEGKQLEEHIHGEEPPQVVREWHPEVATALLPDPGMMDRRGCWIKAQIPGDHGE